MVSKGPFIGPTLDFYATQIVEYFVFAIVLSRPAFSKGNEDSAYVDYRLVGERSTVEKTLSPNKYKSHHDLDPFPFP